MNEVTFDQAVLESVSEVTDLGSNIFSVKARIKYDSGEIADHIYVSSPTDTFGLNPAIRQWLTDHKGQYPVKAPPPPVVEVQVIVVSPADLWKRTTLTEALAIEAEMLKQDFRLRMIFNTASVYRSDDELWPLLMGIAVRLFGETRAKVLLAPSK